MDMRKFAGSRFITVDDLRDGPREEVIISVEPGNYDRPVATFESGDKRSLNVTNVNTLIKAYGPNDKDWIGCVDRACHRQRELQRRADRIRRGETGQPAEAARGAHAGAEAPVEEAGPRRRHPVLTSAGQRIGSFGSRPHSTLDRLHKGSRQ